MLDTYLVIGEISKPQGIRGEVKVRPITCNVSRFFNLEELFMEKDGTYFSRKIDITRVEPDAVYMRFEGVEDRNAAELLRGQLLYMDRAHVVELPEDAEFICDLIGCVGKDDSGQEIGELVEVLQPGGNDVYVFEGPLGEVLVPALKSVILNVNVREKTMLLSKQRLAEVAVFNEN